MIIQFARAAGTGVLAGVAGAAFAGSVAGLLDSSVVIASTVAGVLLALIVGTLVYRYPLKPTREPGS